MPKISVIVPVFNVEKYLKECLESIINQTFKDIEIICVNDGSTDSSLEILNNFAEQDNRIKVITQSNQGLSAARNTGIKYANGEYISFIDSDDYIDTSLYETLVKYLPAEMICFNAQAFGDNFIPKKMQKNLICKINGLEKISDKSIFKTNVYAWNKLFKTDIIKKYNLKFPNGLYFEDFVFLWDYMLKIKTAYYLKNHKALYYYRQRPTSIMNTCHNRSIDHLYAWYNLYERLKEQNILNKHKKSITKLFEIYYKLAYNLSDCKNKNTITETTEKFAKEIKYKNFEQLKQNIKTNKPNLTLCQKIFSINNKEKFGLQHKIFTILGIKLAYAPSTKPIIFPKNTQTIIFNNIENYSKNSKRLAIFASFSKNGKIADYVIYYLKELKKVCENIIFISDSPIFPEELEKIKNLIIYAQFKRHNEYDFGSYKYGFQIAQENKLLDNIEELIICNDSCYGPVYPFNDIFNEMQNKKCDFWGLSSDIIEKEHVQSFFYVFKNNIFKTKEFAKFLNNVKHQRNVAGVIREYEVGFTHYLTNLGYTFQTLVPLEIKENSYNKYINKTTSIPCTLIKDYKFPLIKIKIFDKKTVLQEQSAQITLNYLKNINYQLYKIICEDLNIKD